MPPRELPLVEERARLRRPEVLPERPAAGAHGAEPLGTVHVPQVRAEAPGVLEQARRTLGEPAYTAAWAQGHALTLEQAITYALDEHTDTAPDDGHAI